MGVPEARKLLCDLFGLMDAQVLRIEREGLDSNWPPSIWLHAILFQSIRQRIKTRPTRCGMPC
jgi:hypothetical protein